MLPMRRQNETLNAIKAIACVCVVFMHCEFPGALGVYVQAISRWCVPFFFMISGYFCLDENFEFCSRDKVFRKLLHILSLTGGAVAFYIAVNLMTSLWSGQFSFCVTPKMLFKFVAFNVPFFVPGQLWFLFALVGVYIAVYCLLRLNLSYVIIPLGIVMCIVYLCLAQGFHLLGIGMSGWVYRSWVVEGIAFFSLGALLRCKSRSLSRTWFFIVLLVISSVLCLLERRWMGRDFGVQICSFMQVVSIFAIGILCPSEKETWLSRTGKYYSMLVYVLHPFVWHSVEDLYRLMTWDGNLFALYVMPILVVALTFVLSACVNVVNRRVRRLYA